MIYIYKIYHISYESLSAGQAVSKIFVHRNNCKRTIKYMLKREKMLLMLLEIFNLNGRDREFEFNLCPFTQVSNLSRPDMYLIKSKQQKGSLLTLPPVNYQVNWISFL